MKSRDDHKQILIIDDSDSDRARVRSALLRGAPGTRYRFLEAPNVQRGWEICDAHATDDIDCIVVDVHMPGATGIEFLQRLQAQDGYPRFPVVVLTGSSGESVAQPALEAGAQDYLSKAAVLPEVLPRVIDNAIARHEMTMRLRESERRAELANQAKSAFIANMSHEIRTPMTAILGFAMLLDEQEKDPSKREYIESIQHNGTFLLELINDILDVSKIEAGKMQVEMRRFAPHALLAEVHSMMIGRTKNKGIELDSRVDGDVPAEIESDPKRLKQILVNLVGNAVKFTESGKVSVRLSFLPGEPAKIRYSVRDTGIGMSSEQQERLFEPFSQGDASVNRRYGGTGLGLAISQRLAQLLGGEISCRSEPSVGSTFAFTIDAGDHSDEMLHQPSLDLVRQMPAVPEVKQLQCRVLVIDDRRDVRFLATHFLQKAGATVEVAEDGVEGVEFIEAMFRGDREPLDLILLDMQMPRLDGYQTATRIRSMGFEKPIIALTADAMHGDMKRCIDCGCNAYLSKPIDVDKLVGMVASYTQTVHGVV